LVITGFSLLNYLIRDIIVKLRKIQSKTGVEERTALVRAYHDLGDLQYSENNLP
jgi:hypothetical protein